MSYIVLLTSISRLPLPGGDNISRHKPRVTFSQPRWTIGVCKLWCRLLSWSCLQWGHFLRGVIGADDFFLASFLARARAGFT